MTLTLVQRGQLDAFRIMHQTLQDIIDKDEELNRDMIMDMLRVFVAFFEAYEGDEE